MKMLVYESIFRCTETLQNGKERTIKKSVFTPRHRGGKHVTETQRIAEGTAELEAEHYYNIEYVGVKATSLRLIL